MIPWLTIPAFTFAAKALNERLASQKMSTTRVRKITQSICFGVQNFALFLMCHTTSFPMALLCMSIITGNKLFCISPTVSIVIRVKGRFIERQKKKSFFCAYLFLHFIFFVYISGANGFHNSSCTINPQDLAPNHSGSVFGLMNTAGSIPGFLGVYLAGHILELTQSWSAVFSTAISINFIGWIVFVLFASADPIV